MANSYYGQTYGHFRPIQGAEALHGQEKEVFAIDWNAAVNRLKDSGVDLTKIRLVIKK